MCALTLVPRPTLLGLPPKPKIIAATKVDFPVPLGPIIKFKLAPGCKSAELYVLKLQNYTLNWHYSTCIDYRSI